MAVAMEKVTYCRLDFLNFHVSFIGNRVRLFHDSVPKCLKVTTLPFKKVTFATEHHLF